MNDIFVCDIGGTNSRFACFSETADKEIIFKTRIYAENYKTVDETQVGLFEYIEIFYNRKRRHSAIGNIRPHQYEQQYKQLNMSTFRG